MLSNSSLAHRSFGRSAGRSGVVELRLKPHRAWWVQALVLLWRWRVELAAVGLALVVVGWLADRLPAGLVVAVLAGPVLVVLAIPASRRYTAAHAWCTVTRHRLRLAFVEAGITNRSGRLPWVIWVRPTPVGERAWCWLPPGLAYPAVARGGQRTSTPGEGGGPEGLAVLASTCWARDARMQPLRAVITLVRLDVIRRDPLATTKRSRPIPNRLLHLAHPAPAPAGDTAGEPAGPAGGPPPAAFGWAGCATRPATPTPAPLAVQPVLINGEDVSDYAD